MLATAIPQIARFSSKATPKGCNSVMLALSPVPNSTRPFDTRSSAAMRSAQRAGWVVVNCMMPWARRIRLVRWLAAARNTSGAGECEYSSRK